MPYNAGIAYLQVVPSFVGIEAEIAKQAEKMGAQLEGNFERSMRDGATKGMRAAEAEASRSGETAGGAFAQAFRSSLDKGLKSVADLEVRADTSDAEHALGDVDRAVAQIRKDMLDLRHQRIGIGLDIDESTAIAAMQDLRQRARSLLSGQSGELTAGQFTDLSGLDRQLGSFEKLVEEARRQGLLAGDAYGGALDEEIAKGLDKSLTQLPKIKLETDSSEVTKTAEQLRVWVEELRRTKVGVDVDLPAFRGQLAAVEGLLREFSEQHADTPLGFNLGQAADTLGRLGATTDPRGVAEAKAAAEAATQAARDEAAAEKQAARDAAEARKQALREVAAEAKATAAAEKEAARDAAASATQYERDRVSAEKQALSEATARVKQAARDRAEADKQAARDAAEAAKQAAREAASQFEGSFQTSVGKQLTSALQKLGTFRIDADSTPAQVRIAEIREQLRSLSDQRLHLDDAEVVAKVTALRDQLRQMAAHDTSIQVRVDAGQAAAELGTIVALQKEVGSKKPRADVETNAGAAEFDMRKLASTFGLAEGQMAVLVGLGPAIGAAIVPGVVAATAALLSFGAAAVAAVGVSVLGFAGVGKALTSMNTEQNKTAQGASSLTNSQNQVANALDSVSGAERSLANTRAQVADGARQAAQQVTDAQKQVTTAERDALSAENALNDARETARRQLQDQANQLKDLAIQQEQANLDLRQAKAQLDAVSANPQATADEREQARITFEQRTQQLAELGVQQQRLQQDNAKAAAAGVEGSSQVTAAQDKIRQATDQVAHAQEQLQNAVRQQQQQQREGTFQITQATQAVTSAQRGLADATVKAGTAGGAAMNNLQAAMNNLSPAGQRFAVFLYGLKPVLDSLRGSAQEGLLPGAQAGIEALLPLVPKITGYTREFAGEVGHLAAEAGHAFAGPYWQQFLDQVAGQALPAMEQGAHIAYNFAVAISGVTSALLPLGGDVGAGVLHFSQSLADSALNLDHSQGFQHLLGFIHTEGPRALDTVEAVARAAGHVVVAVAPIGGTTLAILRALASIIDSIPTPVLTILAGGALQLAAAMKLYGLAQSVVNGAVQGFNAVVGVGKTVMDEYQFQLGTLRTRALEAGVAEAELNTELIATEAAGIAAGEGMSALLGVLGGPLGIAIGLAVIGFTALSNSSENERQKIDGLKSAFLQLRDALTQTGQVNSDAVKSLVNSNPDVQQAIQNADQYGISLGSLSNALQGNKEAQNAVTDALNNKIRADQNNAAALLNPLTSAAQDKKIKDEQDLRDALNGTWDQIDKNIDVNAKLDAAQNKQGDGTRQLSAAQVALAVAYNKVGDAQASATDKAQALRAADQAIFGDQRNQIEAQLDEADAQSKVVGIMSQYINQKGDAKKALDLSTQAGRDNERALIGEYQAVNNVYFAQVQAGVAEDQARKAHDASTDALAKSAKAAGFNADEVDRLAAAFGQVPTDPKVEISVVGVEEALTQMENLEIAQLALKQGIDVSEATREWKNQHPGATGAHGGLAAGGPVSGPGGPTDDLIPAWLSNGEHVWTAAEVAAAGGHDAIMALRQWVLGGASPSVPYPGDGSHGIAFAQGGPVAWPFPVTAAMTRIPSPAELRSAITVGPQWGGPLPAGVDQIQNWIKAQAGKPYEWDSAGPGGYDCCIVGGVRVYGPDGAKAIETVRAGDRVYSYVDQKLEVHTVTAAWQSAHQPVFTVRTRNRSVTASANHPFLRVAQDGYEQFVHREDADWPGLPEANMTCLVSTCAKPVNSNGMCGMHRARWCKYGDPRITKAGREDADWPGVPVTQYGARKRGEVCRVSTCSVKVHANGMCAKHQQRWFKHGDPRIRLSKRRRFVTQWARLDELSPGDLVVQPRSMPAESVATAILSDGTTIDADVAWLIGASIGDGTVTDRGLRLCLFGSARDRATDIIVARWGGSPTHGPSYGLVVSNKRLVVALQDLGMQVPGPEKRVPAAVWTWPEDLQRAFLNGYCEADGHRPVDQNRHGERTYHSASRELIEDVRALHIMLGDPVSNIHVTKRTKPIVIKGKEVKHARDQHAVAVWPADGVKGNEAGLRNNPGLANWLDTGDFTLNRILGITAAGEQDTWDIEVEGAHNFIADGVVVHNSGALSAVYNLAHHLNPYRHTFSTSNEGQYFTKPGYGPFTAAWTNPGESGPGGTSVGHTAGSFYGLGFESRGGAGFVVGNGITSLSKFAHLAHYDDGGYLSPGWSAVFNGTGSPEPVLNQSQWSSMQQAMQQATQGGGGGNTYQFAFRDTTLDAGRLRTLQNRDAVYARAGRAR